MTHLPSKLESETFLAMAEALRPFAHVARSLQGSGIDDDNYKLGSILVPGKAVYITLGHLKAAERAFSLAEHLI